MTLCFIILFITKLKVFKSMFVSCSPPVRVTWCRWHIEIYYYKLKRTWISVAFLMISYTKITSCKFQKVFQHCNIYIYVKQLYMKGKYFLFNRYVKTYKVCYRKIKIINISFTYIKEPATMSSLSYITNNSIKFVIFLKK